METSQGPTGFQNRRNKQLKTKRRVEIKSIAPTTQHGGFESSLIQWLSFGSFQLVSCLKNHAFGIQFFTSLIAKFPKCFPTIRSAMGVPLQFQIPITLPDRAALIKLLTVSLFFLDFSSRHTVITNSHQRTFRTMAPR